MRIDVVAHCYPKPSLTPILPFTLSHLDVPPGTPRFATARSASLSLKIQLGVRADLRRKRIADERKIRLEELLNN